MIRGQLSSSRTCNHDNLSTWTHKRYQSSISDFSYNLEEEEGKIYFFLLSLNLVDRNVMQSQKLHYICHVCRLPWGRDFYSSSVQLRILLQIMMPRHIYLVCTWRFSLAQADMPRCLIASSVMSSQWDRDSDSRHGQWAESWAMLWSVIWTHSSRSILSRRWHERASAWFKLHYFWERNMKPLTMNPASVRRLTPAHSSITRLGQLLATLT